MGGNLAHAMAAKLQSQRELVAMLFLLDSYPPELTYEQDDLDPDVSVAELIRREAAIRRTMDSDVIHTLTRVATGLLRLVRGAAPPVFTGQMLFIAAARSTDIETSGAALWEPYVDGDIEVRSVPCDHWTMMHPDHVPEVGLVRFTARGYPHESRYRVTPPAWHTNSAQGRARE
jgi:thioesterase domain-containing protein